MLLVAIHDIPHPALQLRSVQTRVALDHGECAHPCLVMNLRDGAYKVLGKGNSISTNPELSRSCHRCKANHRANATWAPREILTAVPAVNDSSMIRPSSWASSTSSMVYFLLDHLQLLGLSLLRSARTLPASDTIEDQLVIQRSSDELYPSAPRSPWCAARRRSCSRQPPCIRSADRRAIGSG